MNKQIQPGGVVFFSLPAEDPIFSHSFEYLEYQALIRCMIACKDWNATIRSLDNIWAREVSTVFGHYGKWSLKTSSSQYGQSPMDINPLKTSIAHIECKFPDLSQFGVFSKLHLARENMRNGKIVDRTTFHEHKDFVRCTFFDEEYIYSCASSTRMDDCSVVARPVAAAVVAAAAATPAAGAPAAPPAAPPPPPPGGRGLLPRRRRRRRRRRRGCMTLLRLRGGSGGKEEGGAGAGGGPVRVAGAGAPPLLPPPAAAAEAASGGRRPQPQGGGGERKVLLCGSEDGRISVWDVTSGQFLGMLLGHLSSINSICSNNTRQSSASVDTNGSIHVWSKEMILSCHSFTTSLQPKSLLHQSIRGQVTALDMYKDSVIFGETLGNATCYIRVIDYAFQQTGLAVRAENRRHAVVIERDSFILVHPPVVVCIAVCENFVAVALGPPNECVLVYDFESLATLLCLNPATLADLSFPNVHIPEICSMCIHSSSELSKELVLKIVIGGNAGECWLVQCGQHDKKEPFRIISAQFTSKQQDSITSCQYFGGLVVSASLDTTVQVIETSGRMMIDVNVALGLIEGYHQERVWAMQFDYTKIVTGCLDNKVRIFCFI